jgi:hypothetical protein
VLKAIVGVLADQDEPMRPKDIHAAVEAALGQPVATSSIKTALIANATGRSPQLVRVAPGRYGLASAGKPPGSIPPSGASATRM